MVSYYGSLGDVQSERNAASEKLEVDLQAKRQALFNAGTLNEVLFEQEAAQKRLDLQQQQREIAAAEVAFQEQLFAAGKVGATR